MEQKDYFVRNSKRIINHLNDMIKHRCSLLVTFDNQQSFLTAILEVDSKNNLLKFDCSRTESLNRQLLNSSKVLFRTELEGIKVSFKGWDIKQKSGDKTMFVMPIPESIYWMQRRDCYRIRVPYEHNSNLQIVLKSSGKNYTMDTFTKKFRLIDISINGFSFLNLDNDLQWHFESNIEKMQGKIIKGALFLRDHEHDQSNIEFAIRNIEKIKNAPGQYRVGCEFTEISPSFQANVQRYMQRIELDARAKAEGI